MNSCEAVSLNFHKFGLNWVWRKVIRPIHAAISKQANFTRILHPFISG